MKRNPKVLKLYEKRIGEWIQAFGLTDWKYRVKWLTDEPTDGNVDYNTTSRFATFGLHPEIQQKDAREVSGLALHEVLHLVLADYTAITEQFFQVSYLSSMEHAIIQRIINAMGVK
jgi:predicted metal-dependent peptidase